MDELLCEMDECRSRRNDGRKLETIWAQSLRAGTVSDSST